MNLLFVLVALVILYSASTRAQVSTSTDAVPTTKPRPTITEKLNPDGCRQGEVRASYTCERHCATPEKYTCKCTAGCQCRTGFFRCHSGVCAPWADCDSEQIKIQNMTEPESCGPNETFYPPNDPRLIDPDMEYEEPCEGYHYFGKTDPAKIYRKTGLCRCNAGYWRSYNECIKEDECTAEREHMVCPASNSSK